MCPFPIRGMRIKQWDGFVFIVVCCVFGDEFRRVHS